MFLKYPLKIGNKLYPKDTEVKYSADKDIKIIYPYYKVNEKSNFVAITIDNIPVFIVLKKQLRFISP